jgi:hypothetical protein
MHSSVKGFRQSEHSRHEECHVLGPISERSGPAARSWHPGQTPRGTAAVWWRARGGSYCPRATAYALAVDIRVPLLRETVASGKGNISEKDSTLADGV